MQKTVAENLDPFTSYCASKFRKISASSKFTFLTQFCPSLLFSCVYYIKEATKTSKTIE